ncbi:lysophospholipid acyltransferase family protein [Gymnodinialimonas ceratoperidinii]|uniref:1-acyl-sn-glycerol-3-phosphate acyltransferase n=1 Tax=Gymnodinialimonas ceratoperidinii TaxID=2856823 RepID=A0A8F6TXY0_9RHOB|nr:lysophospholipid acyltransferase family protein [Gymnodinialimonas ceratoperidinii]QXT39752.1 1-acyl-sn-glycerol-3-phosphate acyltransferase [Gymnodinialimonas ceratoperidinii]
MQTIRSFLHIVQMYAIMPVIAVIYFPWALVSRRGAEAACHAYCAWVFWTLKWMVGLSVELRGEIPTGEVMIAAKHQSFLDVMAIYHAVPHGKFIMKRELMFAPILGQYALRIGCVPVNRGKRGAAIRKMLDDVRSGKQQGGQLIIYPQGTRIAPGVSAPYKAGTGALYAQMGQPCVPVATNIGVFWPKTGITRKQGVAVVEFLPPIEPGLQPKPFLARLEAEIETNSDALLEEAGFIRVEP